MSKIRIKNFGPIKDGFDIEDGFMDIKKVTVFIGDQGTGKSTVAKLISMFMWLEKATNRGDFGNALSTNVVVSAEYYSEYQLIQNYFLSNTIIEYVGSVYVMVCDGNSREIFIDRIKNRMYIAPQLMYVSAERNFLTTITSAYDVKNLPGHLITFAEEFKRAQKELNGMQIELPIKGYKYEYIESNNESIIYGKNHRINLYEASSGLQSLTPLFLVSRNLASSINNTENNNLSVNQRIRRNEEITKLILNKSISETLLNEEIERIMARYINKCFINIVEEPEQNLFPTSQRHMLNSLVEFANMTGGNKLIMTTHSPYIINYLTLATKAKTVLDKIENLHKEDLKGKLDEVVPVKSTIASEDLIIYELKDDGTIKQLEMSNGLPSDDNYLNQQLAETNYLFTDLLEIEDQCQ